jgi:hypothetical protein
MKVGTVRHLYTQGLRDYEIAERLQTPLIQIQHAITFICMNCPDAESKHYINRHQKGRYVRARFINDDPYYEKVCRFEVAL